MFFISTSWYAAETATATSGSVRHERAIAVYMAVGLREIIWNAHSAYSLSNHIRHFVDTCFRNIKLLLDFCLPLGPPV